MLRQIQYFQAVVRTGSFSEAAEECYISQSAISQQIQALERELGFPLLIRQNRKFSLTPAGEYFYKKSLVLTADFERLRTESAKIAGGNKDLLRVGYLRSYGGEEFHRALEQFSTIYPDVELEIEGGNHEELYQGLLSGSLDVVLNDQRRAFSQSYMNIILMTSPCYIEVSARSPLAQLQSVTAEELKNTPCVLVSSDSQRDTEAEYYRDIVGFQGEMLFADNLEQARMLVVSGKGFMPVDIGGNLGAIGVSIARIPLYEKGEPATRNYCAFWRKERTNPLIEAFAKCLKEQFA